MILSTVSSKNSLKNMLITLNMEERLDYSIYILTKKDLKKITLGHGMHLSKDHHHQAKTGEEEDTSEIG
jgi:hypothetical protein